MNGTVIPRFYIEQYVLGESSAEVTRVIENDPRLREEAQLLRKENERFLQAVPPELMVPGILSKAGIAESGIRGVREKSARWSVEYIFPGLVAAVLVVALIPVLLLRQPGRSGSEGIAGGDAVERVKGLDPGISVFRNTGDSQTTELEDGDAAAPGDALQIVYHAAGAEYGTIFSVDGRGTVTLHYPATVFENAVLDQDGTVALPYSYVLDDSPGFERFFFVTSHDSLNVGAILTLAETIAADRPSAVLAEQFSSDSVNVTELTVRKSEVER